MSPPRDKIDILSERWSERYADIRSGPWQVWGRLSRIHEQFVAEASRALAPFDLTYKEFQTLGALVLVGEPYASPTQLADFSMLSSGGTANLLGRLEAKGLIVREADPDDGRGVRVGLTSEGGRRFRQALAAENLVEHRLLAALSGAQRERLATLLRGLAIGFETAPSPGDPRTARRAALAGRRRAADR